MAIASLGLPGTAPAQSSGAAPTPRERPVQELQAREVADPGLAVAQAPVPGAPTAPNGSEAATSGLPVGFVDEVIIAGWNRAAGVTFAADGRAVVWEKAGIVTTVVDGAKVPNALVNIAEEVADWEDYGLISVALDPGFLTNGYLYLVYTVDHHHLAYFGTPQYNPGVSEPYTDTIGRLTRYTADPATGFTTVIPGSRLVLLGESVGTGIPIAGTTHGPGGIAFGDDGTLLLTCGDGALGVSSGTALAEGIIKPKENVGAFRAQLVDSLSGKLLRIDAATGDGVPGNPYFDPLEPRAPRSRVFALGLRQPFRMTLIHGSGSLDPAAADPGTVLIGDVGAEAYEELNIVRAPAVNLGWPLHEGLHDFLLAPNLTANLDAPNPLAGTGGCTQAFFNFQDLLVEDTLDTPAWGNPCAPQVPITNVPTFVHQRPVLEWGHLAGASVPIYDGNGDAAIAGLGTPNCPVAGTSFSGSCSVGGCWYEGRSFPATYHDTYFLADYVKGWIRNLVFDGAGNLVEVRTFAEPVGRPVGMAVDPVDGSLWYVNYTDQGLAQLRRIRYLPGNLPPQAVISASVSVGPSPLLVTLDASGSSDPEGQPLDVRWEFGDGTPASHLVTVSHLFPSEDITPAGSIVGAVFGLVPPGSTGFSNDDPNVMRDGDMPPVGTSDKKREYDTWHTNAHSVNDKPLLDWIGYNFGAPRELRGLLFQEGMMFPGGGWFDPLSVQVLFSGAWSDIPGVTIQPAYPGDILQHYDTFEIAFPPIVARAIRLQGVPGGVSTVPFVTIGELRVTGAPTVPSSEPQNITVTLTVTDPAGATSQASQVVTLNDTPPQLSIIRPDEFLTYDPSVTQTLSVAADVTDVEEHETSLACTWQVIHHHDEHNHPGDIVPGATQIVTLAAEGCDGDVHWIELHAAVTDALGLTATAVRHVIPICDLDLDGAADADAIAAGKVSDRNGDDIPDAAQTDCNGNGRPDLYEILFGYSADLDQDGVPDECGG